MNYERHYYLLVQTRKLLEAERIKLSAYIYYEWHHIVPVCMGGGNEASNFVLLTPKEHFIAHWLLARKYNTKTAWHALGALIRHKSRRHLSEFEICQLRIALSKAMSGESNHNYCKPIPEHIRIKISIANTGKPGPNVGKPRSAEAKAKQSIAMSGENNYWYGKVAHNRGKQWKEGQREKREKTSLIKTYTRLNEYGPIIAENIASNERILLLEAINIIDFCRIINAHMNHAEGVIKGKCNYVKGWRLYKYEA